MLSYLRDKVKVKNRVKKINVENVGSTSSSTKIINKLNKYYIIRNRDHCRKIGWSSLLVVSKYSIVEFQTMKLVEAVKSLSLYRKNWVI